MSGQGHDPLTFSFLSSFLFFDWVGVLWPQLPKVLKPVCWAGSVPFPPVSLQRQVVCLLLWPVFISGESLHRFLVGVKSYVIATSGLWLFINASNLLPSTPHPAPLHTEKNNNKTSLAADTACVAIFWPTPGLKGRTFVSSGFSTEGTLISVSQYPTAGDFKQFNT